MLRVVWRVAHVGRRGRLERSAANLRAMLAVARELGGEPMKPATERYIVTLRAEPPGRDALGRDGPYRLRLFLKRALRAYGLRAVSVEFATTQTPSDSTGEGSP